MLERSGVRVAIRPKESQRYLLGSGLDDSKLIILYHPHFPIVTHYFSRRSLTYIEFTSKLG